MINFVLSLAEHEKSCISLGPALLYAGNKEADQPSWFSSVMSNCEVVTFPLVS